MTRDDGYTRYTVRIPTPLYERVKYAAGEKSVNAEIVAALEKAYPPKFIDIGVLTEFLEAAVAMDTPEEQKEFVDSVNRIMAAAQFPWTMKADGFGVVQFFPYKSDPAPPDNKAED